MYYFSTHSHARMLLLLNKAFATLLGEKKAKILARGFCAHHSFGCLTIMRCTKIFSKPFKEKSPIELTISALITPYLLY